MMTGQAISERQSMRNTFFVSEYQFRIESPELESELLLEASTLNVCLSQLNGFRDMKVLQGLSHKTQFIMLMHWTEEKEYKEALHMKGFKQFLDEHSFIVDYYTSHDFIDSNESAKQLQPRRKVTRRMAKRPGKGSMNLSKALSWIKVPSNDALFPLAFVLGIALAILILIYR
ncbi:MAG: hypothetical protein F6K11_00780 [Leptolyngbya sp. SIO3F4]|nr:hypothetical protein [Leptolyngbya sp. SIO3F4]